MGYCYSHSGGLLCDFCGATGAKKYRCPFGYCAPIAACPACHTKHAQHFGRAAHRAQGCEDDHLHFLTEMATRAFAIATGEFVLCAGLNAENDMVHAIFRGATGEKGKLIPRAIYAQRESFTGCMTLAKFEELAGHPLPDAPASFTIEQKLLSNGHCKRTRNARGKNRAGAR
jgi:hypothetical protein